MSDGGRSDEASRREKAPDAFRTISEVAEDLELPQHVLRFWETRFSQIKPLKRGGGRRYYRPQDVELLRGIRHLLYGEGYTIRGVQRILREQGLRFVVASGKGVLPGPLPADLRDETDDEEPPAAVSRKLENTETPTRPLRLRPIDDEDDGASAIAQRIAGIAAPPPPAPIAPEPEAAEDEAVDASQASVAPRLSGDDVRRLELTLADLLECKRILDQARQA